MQWRAKYGYLKSAAAWRKLKTHRNIGGVKWRNGGYGGVMPSKMAQCGMAKNGGMAKIMAAWRGVSVMAKIGIKMAACENNRKRNGRNRRWRLMASANVSSENNGENGINGWRNG
jgi:hypothetical protein